MRQLKLILHPGRLAVCRLEARAAIPAWAGSENAGGGFCSVTRTAAELSVVCAEQHVPADVRHEAGWRAFEVAGPLEFTLTGILAALCAPLAAAGIPLFAVSTFDTDYVLVKQTDVGRAADLWTAGGHQVATSPPPEPLPEP